MLKLVSIKNKLHTYRKLLIAYSLVVISLLFVFQYALWGSQPGQAANAIVESRGIWCRGEDNDLIPGHQDLPKGTCTVPTDQDDLLNFNLCAEGSQTGEVYTCEDMDDDGNCLTSTLVETFTQGENSSCEAMSTKYNSNIQINIGCTSPSTQENTTVGMISCKGASSEDSKPQSTGTYLMLKLNQNPGMLKNKRRQ